MNSSITVVPDVNNFDQSAISTSSHIGNEKAGFCCKSSFIENWKMLQKMPEEELGKSLKNDGNRVLCN